MIRADTITFRLFVLVCELHSVSRAAAASNLAVSAASRRLALLESNLETPLLIRRPHGVEPTAEGLTVLNYARDVLRLTNELEVALKEYRSGVRGRVRISASSSALVRRLAADLSSFGRANRDIVIDLEERPTRATLDALLLKNADIGVVVKGPLPKGIEVFPYADDCLAIALPRDHSLAKRSTLSLEDLLEEDFVALDATTAVHRAMSDFAAERGHELKIRVQVRSFETMCQMISHGLGIGIIPDHAVEPLADALNLAVVPLVAPFAQRELVVVIRAGEVLAVPTARLLQHLLH
jgi:DNA-binding transcriptional LysR family regulator